MSTRPDTRVTCVSVRMAAQQALDGQTACLRSARVATAGGPAGQPELARRDGAGPRRLLPVGSRRASGGSPGSKAEVRQVVRVPAPDESLVAIALVTSDGAGEGKESSDPQRCAATDWGAAGRVGAGAD
jgi:hypothetical protein